MKNLLTVLLTLVAVHTHAQIINTIAGTGVPGFSGDGGPATAAQFDLPAGMARDTAGNLYVIEFGNYRVRKINTAGIIETYAGDGTVPLSGYFENAPAVNSAIGVVGSIACDLSGNLYIASSAHHRIYKVNTSGIITTVAGSSAGTFGYSGDGGPATAGEMNTPWGVVTDFSGNVFFADKLNNCVRKVSAAGILSTVAGSTTAGFGGDGGPATAALLNRPTGLTMSCSGELYIADQFNSRIRKVSAAGIITTVAGDGVSGFGGDGGPATAAHIKVPWEIAIDGNDNLYIADCDNDRVRKVTSSGIITTYAGGTFATLENVPATATLLSDPTGLVVDENFDVYLSEYYNHRIRKVTGNPMTIIPIPLTDSLCPGDTITLPAYSIPGGKWTHTNTAVATVSATGLITGIAPGIDTIKYTLPDICSNIIAVYTMTIRASSACATHVLNSSDISGTSIIPNPNTGHFSLFVPARFPGTISATVFNMLGTSIKELSVTANTNSDIVLDIPPGIYMLCIYVDGVRQISRFVVR